MPLGDDRQFYHRFQKERLRNGKNRLQDSWGRLCFSGSDWICKSGVAKPLRLTKTKTTPRILQTVFAISEPLRLKTVGNVEVIAQRHYHASACCDTMRRMVRPKRR